MRNESARHDVWHRAPRSICGLVSCATCEHFLEHECSACALGNSKTRHSEGNQCAVYACVKSQGVSSCRECRSDSCLILESDGGVECGLAAQFNGGRNGRSLVQALVDLKSLRSERPAVNVPPRVRQRLPRYLVALNELSREGVQHVASAELALRVGISTALARKDLSTIGHWGRRSAGYAVEALCRNLRRVAGLAEQRHAAWLGCERLSKYARLIEEFRSVGCIISAAFCHDGRHVGQEVNGLLVRPVEELPDAARTLGLSVAVIATDDNHAEAVAELAVSAGIGAILNLTDKSLAPPRGATVENVSPVRGIVSLLLRTPRGEDSGQVRGEVAEHGS